MNNALRALIVDHIIDDDTPVDVTPPAPPTYTISGVVYDSDGSTPVQSATVALGLYTATSAANGTYTISDVPVGESGSMTCTKSGHSWTAISIAAMAGNLTNQNYTNAWWAVKGLGNNVVVAYRSKGAGSRANSYINLKNPGTGDLTEKGTQVGWNDSNGWNGSGGGLSTNVNLPTTFSAAMKVKWDGTITRAFWGAYNSNISYVGINGPEAGGAALKTRYGYGAAGTGSVSWPANELLTHVATGTATTIKGYTNGSQDLDRIDSSMSPSTDNIFILCDNYNGNPHDAVGASDYMTSYVIYDKVLTTDERTALEAVLP